LTGAPIGCTIGAVRIGIVLGLVVLLLAAAPAANADDPGTYGGPADRFCGPAAGRLIVVGATRVSCRVARRVATGVVRGGKRFRRWRCPGARKGRAYGHCHGRGSRRGAIVHWGVND
jgi:hypothetical protein